MDLSGEEVGHIVKTLSHGNQDDIASLIYGNEMLTERQLEIPLRLLDQLHTPSPELLASVTDAGYQEPFWMLILNVPWRNEGRGGPYFPLLIAHQHEVPKVAGIVMPWNEISHMFTREQKDANGRLVTWWAIFLKKLNAPSTPSKS